MFKTFPEFSKLTLAYREEYEAFAKDLPPLGDLSFGTLMLWWNVLGGLAVSRLNGNLVISYWIPGDEEHSGLSLVGTQDVDQSICVIFDYLRERGEPPRLANVPEFVVNSMRYPELFGFKSGRGDDEYLIATTKFASMDNAPQYMRTRVRRFAREAGQGVIRIEGLDLHAAANRQLVLDAAADWPLKGVNNVNKLEREVLPTTISPEGAALGVRCVGLYIDDELHAFCLYFYANDHKYAIIPHARVNYDIPRIFDYAVHAFCKYFQEQGIEFINIHADNGSLKMRALKIALKPDNFFRKYTIEPMV